MSIDPRQALITQFSQFMAGRLSTEEWKTITRMFGAGHIADNTKRFYRSKFFNDEDEANRTADFLEEVNNEDEEVAFAIMKRAYDMTDGVTQAELEKYPALSTLENEEITPDKVSFSSFSTETELFVDIDNISGNFYPRLVNQVNQCYRLGVYDATLVLSRKLIENLLIDILRAEFHTEDIDMYYDPNNKRFHPFYRLVSNLEDNLESFEHHSSALDNEFIKKLHTFRQTANRRAHSLEIDLNDEGIKKYGERVEYLAKVLFRIRGSV